jgi:serine protease Do
MVNRESTSPVDSIHKDPHNNKITIDKSGPTYQVNNKAPGNLMRMEEAIAAVKDSVVEITTERVKSGFGSFSQYVVSGAGSGVIISTNGYIITNHHVIEDASNIIVRLTSGKEYPATLVGTDSKTDVAVISIIPDEGDTLTAAVIGSSEKLLLGQTVIAIGNPLGKLGGTVSDGIISCLAREIAMEGSGTMTLLQTNAAVSPGNSGGGLFDLYGRLIGVVNAKSTGEGVEGISFAIPIDTAWDVANQLLDKGYVSGRPSLGVSIKQVQYGYSIFGDMYYQLIVTGSNADNALKNDDIIYAIDNIETITLTDISDILSSKKIGDKVTVSVSRNKKLLEIEVTLVEYVPQNVNVPNS